MINLHLHAKFKFMTKSVTIISLLLTGLFQQAAAQYYHKDIISTKQAQAEKKLMQEKKVRTVKVHSFDADGTASEGFFCERKFSKDYSEMETVTKANTNTEAVLTTVYNNKGLIAKTTDSSEIMGNTSAYDYDAAGNIISITAVSSSSDDDFKTIQTETHRYYYNEKGIPVKMSRVKNNRDSTQVNFIHDEKGNITDEIELGAGGKHYYYYYNAENKLSDIVRYNEIKKQLRADFSFEYDEDGRVVQMITVEDGGSNYYNAERSNYFVWKYVYNEGLKIIEKCFSRDKQLLGYVEYEYD